MRGGGRGRLCSRGVGGRAHAWAAPATSGRKTRPAQPQAHTVRARGCSRLHRHPHAPHPRPRFIAWLLTVGGAYKGLSPETQAACSTDQSRALETSPWFRVPYPGGWVGVCARGLGGAAAAHTACRRTCLARWRRALGSVCPTQVCVCGGGCRKVMLLHTQRAARTSRVRWRRAPGSGCPTQVGVFVCARAGGLGGGVLLLHTHKGSAR